MSRTDWAEEFVEHFAARPLTQECVYRSPRYLPADKELCDYLLLLRGSVIGLELKCQEDPTKRTGPKLGRWATKAAKRAATQVRGALRSLQTREFYCDHFRIGRIRFQPGELDPKHLLVLVEVTERVQLPDALPLEHDKIPLTYLSANDFLNLVDQLRAFPDLRAYLDARTSLSAETRRMIGNERPLFEYYLVRQSFENCVNLKEAERFVECNRGTLQEAIDAKIEADRYAILVERVVDALAERHPDYAQGLDAEALRRFDDDANRRNRIPTALRSLFRSRATFPERSQDTGNST